MRLSHNFDVGFVFEISRFALAQSDGRVRGDSKSRNQFFLPLTPLPLYDFDPRSAAAKASQKRGLFFKSYLCDVTWIGEVREEAPFAASSQRLVMRNETDSPSRSRRLSLDKF